MSELIHMHSIGNSLKDVKVEFKKELKLDVSGISIEGKQGEILNIPRWAANVLESEKYVEIQDVDMLVELKQAVEKEKCWVSLICQHFKYNIKQILIFT
uniref:GINS subunit domain-containing protein n=1 Tax=uncultured marine thaumarchaeote SAT1000_04_F07 TaxID=1456355 RepID=A0A075I6C8_9ARCH|nr:hypothetical protein [uncultured marine thaumarchaeote SAT1000_04_F07]